MSAAPMHGAQHSGMSAAPMRGTQHSGVSAAPMRGTPRFARRVTPRFLLEYTNTHGKDHRLS